MVRALFDSSDPRPLYFLGIGGAGMSALAITAIRRGVKVVGSDNSSDGLSDLRAAGATVYQGTDPGRVIGSRAVVYTAAAPTNHPELVAARQAGIEIVTRKAALAELVAGRTVVAIAGTHGKTTTTVMTTLALQGAGLEPSALAGGRVPAWSGNAWLAGDEVWVVEADEYDKAFLALSPTIAVITNVEADHLECYGTVVELEAAFLQFAEPAATVLVGTADPGSDRVATALGSRVLRFGFESTTGIVIDAVERRPSDTTARVTWPDGLTLRLSLIVPGDHNVRNAVAALGAVRALGGNLAGAAGALAAFAGVGRRFERGPEVRGVAFVDDYAHHPTELVATIAAARQAFPERRLVAVFQPHLFSRTAAHHVAMGTALQAVDVAVVTDVYPAREAAIPGITGQLVADGSHGPRTTVIYQPIRAELDRTVAELALPGDLVLTLGAGDVTQVGAAVRSLLGAAA